MKPVLGIEEEVFICEPERPTLRSLYYLARLLAKRPLYYYTHSAHNFARGEDVRQCLMSGVEISTAMHEDIDSLIEDLAERRSDLASVSDGLIVPIGHLLDCDTPTNTCAVHVHVSGVPDQNRLFNNLAHFLPVLPVFTMNSPMRNGAYFGKSYRMHRSWAIGPLKQDRTYRFQDLIVSKRLGTVEVRVCDACWDLERIRALAGAIKAIAELEIDLAPDIERYNALRAEIARRGLIAETERIANELASICAFPKELLTQTASDELRDLVERKGKMAAYSAADNAYRHGVFEPKEVVRKRKSHVGAGILGVAAYFLPRLPYYAWKGIKEN